MMILMSVQYLAPNLAIHLHFYGYSQEDIGIAYGIPAILYATTCPFMFLLTQRIQKRGIILLGFIQVTVAMLMIGGSDSLFEF
jgi:sugar phosphate permease